MQDSVTVWRTEGRKESGWDFETWTLKRRRVVAEPDL